MSKPNKNNIIKSVCLSLAVIIAIPIIIYIVMVLDTNPIIENAKEHFYNPETMYSKDDPFYRYAKGKSYEDAELVKFKLHRRFVYHNFKDGYMDVIYAIEYRDSNGKVLQAGGDIPSKWIIHKENGEWKVVEIIEGP